ncbi:sigma 54-interacting transcriptional regulator [Paraclostridium bifermentans]|nr:sigma 54-interacting transcriptional regulator [Paraclostridium bifermentans]
MFGESGTGKKFFARAIHDYSERKGPFIPVNCSAIPSELFESEFLDMKQGRLPVQIKRQNGYI